MMSLRGKAFLRHRPALCTASARISQLSKADQMVGWKAPATEPLMKTRITYHDLFKSPISKGDVIFNRYQQNVTAGFPLQLFPAPLTREKLVLPHSNTKLSEVPALVWENVKSFWSQASVRCPVSHDIFLRFPEEGVQGVLRFKFRAVSSDLIEVQQVMDINVNLPPTTRLTFRESWTSPKARTTLLTFQDIEDLVALFSLENPDFGKIEYELFEEFYVSHVANQKSMPEFHKEIAAKLLNRWQSSIRSRQATDLEVIIGGDMGETKKADVVMHCLYPAQYAGFAFAPKALSHRAVIALGSNVGDRVNSIEQALQEMKRANLSILKTSSLYETKAMYYEDQGAFLNGACEIETTLEPLALLDVLQGIEKTLGRIKTIDKGPRNIDLDVILYDFQTVDHERLQVPHKLMLEREFVLRPLADICPTERLPPPYDSRSILAYLKNAEAANSAERPGPVSVLSLRSPFLKYNDPTRSTIVMAIMNITPDSFSDGGTHSGSNIEGIEETVKKCIAAGATIIDIGGQSTRPTATTLTAQEELARILPVVKHIRSMPVAKGLVLSIDTFYSEVAREAIRVGADIINDVSGGTLDKEMLPTVAKLRKSIIIMHMRGTPQTMTKLTEYPNGIIEGVGSELQERVKAAEAAGIPRWRVILDPGIGFAKNQAQNLKLLTRLVELRDYPGLEGLPWLVGTSRKSFIGKITGVTDAKERVLGTAATVTASIASGADIVRVHDVEEMVQVVRMADALYRTRDLEVPSSRP